MKMAASAVIVSASEESRHLLPNDRRDPSLALRMTGEGTAKKNCAGGRVETRLFRPSVKTPDKFRLDAAPGSTHQNFSGGSMILELSPHETGIRTEP
jgi:hypothetical protein